MPPLHETGFDRVRERIDQIRECLVLAVSSRIASSIKTPNCVESAAQCVDASREQAVKQLLEADEIAFGVGHIGVMMIRHHHASVHLNAVRVGGMSQAVSDQILNLRTLRIRVEKHPALEAAARDFVATAGVDGSGSDAGMRAVLGVGAITRSAGGAGLLLLWGGHEQVVGRSVGSLQGTLEKDSQTGSAPPARPVLCPPTRPVLPPQTGSAPLPDRF